MMTRFSVTIATLLVLCAPAAHAASLNALPGFTDADFVAACNRGTSNVDCETGVAEIRAGGRSTWELDARPAQGDANQANFAIASNVAYAFRVAFDAVLNRLTVGAGSDASNLQTFDSTDFGASDRFGDTRRTFVRLRAQDSRASMLKDLSVNDTLLGDLTATGTTEWAEIGGVDLTKDFAITGSFLFDHQGMNPQSRFATQFKFTDLPTSEVPLPAPVLLLAGAFGGLAFLRRRKRATA